MGGKIHYQNDYIVEGKTTKLIITRSTGEKVIVLIDTEDLDRVVKHNWSAGWREGYQKRYYIQYIDYYYDENGTYKGRTILLHKFIMNVWDKQKVDHKDHDSLNNRKENLRVTSNANNVSHRKGANSNNKTGTRNVHLCKVYGGGYIYKVQIMCKGERYCWEFPLDQFEQACKLAEDKRKELFGEFAGNG